MIKRKTYMNRIRPFIGGDLVKVMTVIRRSGKSVMLELIKKEPEGSGIMSTQFISINYEEDPSIQYLRVNKSWFLMKNIILQIMAFVRRSTLENKNAVQGIGLHGVSVDKMGGMRTEPHFL